MAESILSITHRISVRKPFSNCLAIKQESFRNRPRLIKRLSRKIEPGDWTFQVEFDSSIKVKPIWIDQETLKFLNEYRDEIFISASIYEVEQSEKSVRKLPKRLTKAHDE